MGPEEGPARMASRSLGLHSSSPTEHTGPWAPILQKTSRGLTAWPLPTFPA